MSKVLCNDCEYRIGCENAHKGGSCDKSQQEKARTDFLNMKRQYQRGREDNV